MSNLMASLSPCNTTCIGNTSSNVTEPEYEDPLLPSPLIVLLSIICLLIITVNGLVIFLIYKKKTLRTLTNMFLTSLALSDLMSGLVGIPLLLICLTREIINVCVSSVIFIRFTAISSVCHVLLIACDRYIFIVHDMKYDSLVTKRRAIITTIAVWLVSFTAAVIQLSWYIFHGIDFAAFVEITEDLNKQYSVACIVLFFAVPLLLMCYIYGCIFYISFKLKESDRQIRSSFQQPSRSLLPKWRGRSVLLITVLIFAGCWLPYFVAMLGDYMESSKRSSMQIPVWVERLLVFLSFIPPLLNPILCTLAKRDFRRALKEVVSGREARYHYEQSIRFQAARDACTTTS
ncbi:hypothetical protein OS493_004531 [Desmophyllum pertusum]|uniref:G-protein coupled receptors family 1 profile domain-containing protein n=1 Tax=Desmophyllum pertusum TaxID=174260 RepID=A0A9W9ZFS8_9CNID|nr:hypothetical protein OS493_004531 [Desmophyllum pertusum]